ncbi:MAG: helix-turn-helix domain-containing protein [Beijerinckiaceae bacterium]
MPASADPPATALDLRIAARLRAARHEHDLTLDALAARAGVSRAMISKIERGEASPTASLLARLCNALGFGLSTLFEDTGAAVSAKGSSPSRSPLAQRSAQTVWQDPETGYIRRNVSPRGWAAGMEIVEVTLPAGQTVFFDNAAPLALCQFIWLLDGALTMTVAGQTYPMQPGDCLHMTLDAPLTFHNSGKAAARYAVVIETPKPPHVRERP